MSIKEGLLDQNRMVSDIICLLTLLKNENEKVVIRKAKKSRTFIVETRFLNKAKKLFDKRKVIVNAFEKKDIIPGDLKPEPDLEELESPEKTIAEKKKLRRQKNIMK